MTVWVQRREEAIACLLTAGYVLDRYAKHWDWYSRGDELYSVLKHCRYGYAIPEKVYDHYTQASVPAVQSGSTESAEDHQSGNRHN